MNTKTSPVKKLQKNDTFVLVMPSYNEEKRIEYTVSNWLPVMKKIPGSEMIIIDGSSTDRTLEILEKLRSKYKFITIIRKKREGYGKDLIYGYARAIKTHHKWIFQTDADMPINPAGFLKLWEKRHNSPVILGNRYKRKDPFFRIVMSSFIKLWILMLFKLLIDDSNVPFRLLKKNFLKKSLPLIPSETIAPNIYLSILAKREKYDLMHIPLVSVYRENNKNTKRILKGAFKGLFEISSFSRKIKK